MKVRKAHLPALSLLRHELEVSRRLAGTTVPESRDHLIHPHDTLHVRGQCSGLLKAQRTEALGGIWHSYPTKCYWCFESLSTQMGLLLSPWSEHTVWNQRRQRERLLSLLHPLTHTDILLPPPRFWSLLFGALGSQGRFVSTREDNSGPKKTEIETICSFYH